MKGPVQFIAECKFNKLYLIQSLEDSDLKTGTRLALDTLAPLCHQMGFGLTAYDVKDKDQFLRVLDIIHNECADPNKPVYPILHLEIHGDRSGLGLSPSNEQVTWLEFADRCRKINHACKNNLFVVLAVCHGYQSILSVDIKDVTPFYVLIGPERTITAGYIEDHFPQFYDILIRKQNIDAAVEIISDEYRMYLSEKLFFRAFFKYTKELCVDAGKQQRIEELVQTVQTNLGGQLKNPDEVRKQLDALIKPDPDAFDRLKKRFLMSDHKENAARFSVGFDQLLNIL